MKPLRTYREQVLLRETEAWRKREDRNRAIWTIVLVIATLAVMAIAGCNGSHGRC